MDNLEYSNEALEVKGLFYNKSITVYVEGKDDPLFWETLFSLAEIEAHIEDVGGSKELEKYCNRIINENADFYVAMDNDNSEFMDEKVTHKNIIRTYGYSIENTMYYHKQPIEKIITNFCRRKLDISTEFNDWLSEFSHNVYDLIIYDIANNKYKKGISVFGDNCYKFLEGQKLFKISSEKISNFIDSIKHHFTPEELLNVKEQVNQSEKDLWFLIKGHFITHSLINLIKHTIRKNCGNSASMTPDFLYSITVDCSNDWKNRVDVKTVVDEIKKIKSA